METIPNLESRGHSDSWAVVNAIGWHDGTSRMYRDQCGQLPLRILEHFVKRSLTEQMRFLSNDVELLTMPEWRKKRILSTTKYSRPIKCNHERNRVFQ